jgi:hypothetical protein
MRVHSNLSCEGVCEDRIAAAPMKYQDGFYALIVRTLNRRRLTSGPLSVEDSDARTRVDILHPSKINAIGRMVTVLMVDEASMESRLRLGKRHCVSFPHYCCC